MAELRGDCVVLVPPGGTIPAALVRALGRHRLSPRVVTEAPLVMVALAQAPQRVVIAVASAETPGFADLARAIATYYPATALWRFQQLAEGPRLTAVIEGIEPAASEASRDQPVAEASPAPRVEAEPAAVSAAELAMLLGGAEAEPIGFEDTSDL